MGNLIYDFLEALEDHPGASIGVGIVLIVGGIFASDFYSKYQNGQTERERIKAGLELKTGDYNGNQTIDKFYEIGGEKVPVEVDGKPVIEYFRNK
jgi:hypothetical protein